MIANLTVSSDATAIHINLKRGGYAVVAASTLRKCAMDAASRRERIQTGSINVVAGLQITAVTPMGTTGVNIQFSDGHQKAIYPYSYLQKIAFSSDN